MNMNTRIPLCESGGKTADWTPKNNDDVNELKFHVMGKLVSRLTADNVYKLALIER
jgi:hypothetical protein